MKFAQMYHAEAFPEIFQVSLVTMAIVISMYTPRLFDRARNVPLSRWRTLALRGPLLQVTIIKALIPSIKRSHLLLRNSDKDPPYSSFLLSA